MQYGTGRLYADRSLYVLTGYENGTVTVNDPFSIKNTNTAWTFANIKDQIKAMWTFSKK